MQSDCSSDIHFPSLAMEKHQSLCNGRPQSTPISLTNPSADGLQSAIIVLITKAFNDQKDKGGYCYLNHLIYVSTIAGKWAKVLVPSITEKQIELIKVLGLVHDLYEDQLEYKDELQSILTKHLNKEDVATIERSLDCLTKREQEQYSAYLQRVESDVLATIVKMADCQHNSIIERLPEQMRDDVAKQRCNKYSKRAERLKRFLMQQMCVSG